MASHIPRLPLGSELLHHSQALNDALVRSHEEALEHVLPVDGQRCCEQVALEAYQGVQALARLLVVHDEVVLEVEVAFIEQVDGALCLLVN